MPGLRTERGHIPESGASSTRSPAPGAACPPPASANLGPLPGPLPSLSGAKNVRFRHLRETSVMTSPARPRGLSAPAAARGHARPREPGHPTVHRSRRGTPGQCGVPPPHRAGSQVCSGMKRACPRAPRHLPAHLCCLTRRSGTALGASRQVTAVPFRRRRRGPHTEVLAPSSPHPVLSPGP